MLSFRKVILKAVHRLRVGKFQVDMKSRDITSGSLYSFISETTACDCSGEVNTIRTTATAVTPTTEDENGTNKDVLPGESLEMYIFC